jgi:hypothetical protein
MRHGNKAPSVTKTLGHLCGSNLERKVRPQLTMTNQTPWSIEPRSKHTDHQRAPGPMRDPRRAVRYTLETQVVFSWSDINGLPRESSGCTRDISPKGAYIISACCPPLGTSLTMSFCLPTLTGESKGVQVQTQNRVLRIDSGGAGRSAGFSVENVRTTLCAS